MWPNGPQVGGRFNAANLLLWAGLPPSAKISKSKTMYVKNTTLADLLDNINSAIYVEQQETKRGIGNGEDYMRSLRKQQYDLRELEIAWMTLQDLIELEDRTLEGLHSGAPKASDWKAVFDRARELFQAKGSESAFTNGATGSDDVRG